MGDLAGGLLEALSLLAGGDRRVAEIVLLSLEVSGIALALSTAVGIPVGSWLGLSRFPAKRIVVAALYTGMGFPPVVIGLFVYLLVSRSGPLGQMGLLFTPAAMVIAQTIIAFPLVAGFTMAAVLGVDPNLRQQLISLGATRLQATFAILREARVGVVVSMIAGFGGIISEVGAVMLVGGNIEGSTRVMTTAIVLETRKGEFALAVALGIVLLVIVFFINLALQHLEGRDLGRAH